ncbi:hypothetical protein [Paraburkholderia sp. J10-1]|uniref:hypothetical protein n=1 Tax=Paraburkholderia sp. J10-1 TaxID=2805430 RepID=UPI002AB70D63|nr:hypothetical protein [Paraburkholderia sp. J10-1]
MRYASGPFAFGGAFRIACVSGKPDEDELLQLVVIARYKLNAAGYPIDAVRAHSPKRSVHQRSLRFAHTSDGGQVPRLRDCYARLRLRVGASKRVEIEPALALGGQIDPRMRPPEPTAAFFSWAPPSPRESETVAQTHKNLAQRLIERSEPRKHKKSHDVGRGFLNCSGMQMISVSPRSSPLASTKATQANPAR